MPSPRGVQPPRFCTTSAGLVAERGAGIKPGPPPITRKWQLAFRLPRRTEMRKTIKDGWLEWRNAQLCSACKHVKHVGPCKGLRNMPCPCHERTKP